MIFYIYPSFDIAAVRFFYDSNIGFIYAHNFLIKLIFRAVPVVTILYVMVLLGWTIFLYLKENRNIARIGLHVTLLLSIAFGAGFVVNSLLKDNFGRARPKQIVEFGAKKQFSKVYEFSDQCIKNCSFSSGHAAAAYSLTTIAYLVPLSFQPAAFLIAIGYGCIVGLGRVIQGGHFFSDVFSSACIVLFINYLLFSIYEYIINIHNLKKKTKKLDM